MIGWRRSSLTNEAKSSTSQVHEFVAWRVSLDRDRVLRELVGLAHCPLSAACISVSVSWVGGGP